MSKDRVKDLLVAARKLLSDPRRWTKGAFGRTAKGEVIFSPGAQPTACFCVVGALAHFNKEGRHSDRHLRALQVLEGSLPRQLRKNAISFNDDPATSHADVLALFDRAIARRS